MAARSFGPRPSPSATAARGSGRSLDPPVRMPLERLVGEGLSTVEVHDNPTAAATARALRAESYTVAESIGFAAGRYRPDTTDGFRLLSHEIAHVVQQRRGGRLPDRSHEAEADSVARRARGVDGRESTAAPRWSLRPAGGTGYGVARSPDEWLHSNPDYRNWGFSAVEREIDELDQWLGRQTTSTVESARIEEAVAELRADLARRRRLRQRAARRRPRPRGRERSADHDDTADGPLTEAPRILQEQRSVQYTETADVNDEVDRIMAALERADLSRRDRSTLESELDFLAPQYRQGRTEGIVARHAQRMAQVFETTDDDDVVGQFALITQRLRDLVPDPEHPGALSAYHQGERVLIPAEAVTQMRSRIDQAFRDGEKRTESLRSTGYGYYEHQLAVNREHPIISTIAGWLGDADDPMGAMIGQSVTAASALVRMRQALAGGDYGEAARQLIVAETASRRIEVAGKLFNEGHIAGAQRAVIALEITRDVMFAVAAGLSGGLAAGAVFAAGAGGGGTLALALGAGSLAGAGTRGGLELLGSAGGEGWLSATESDHRFDIGYVGARTWSGVKSGAIDGFVGAGGALVAPGLSNVVANRMFGASASSLTGARSFGVNAVTGGLIGFPSGVVGTGLDLADDVLAGDLSLSDYGSQMMFSGALGLGLGSAMSGLPIRGLYRQGGARGLFRPGAEVVTPRWMMEGLGYHPFQLSPDFVPTANPWRMPSALRGRYGFTPEGPAFAGFNSLPADQLPPLLNGDSWVRVNGTWQPMSATGRMSTPYSLHAQGRSYNLVAGRRGGSQRLVQSHTDTTLPTDPSVSGRSDMAVRHFREVDAAGQTTTRHGPGHNTALADNPDPAVHPLGATGEVPPGLRPDGTPPRTLNESTTNYTPEPYSSTDSAGRNVSDWGQHLRRQLEGLIRSRRGSYQQRNAPSSTDRVAHGSRSRDATNGTTLVEVPDSIIFVETDAIGAATRAWRIDFNNPPTARSLAALDAAPLSAVSNAPITRVALTDLATAQVGATLRVTVPAGQAASYIRESVDAIRESRRR